MNRCLSTGVLAAVGLSGCAWLHPVEHAPMPPVTIPDRYAAGAAASGIAEGKWWTAFQDAALDDLMGRAFRDNLDLKRAYARLDQANAISDGADAGWWPTITAEAAASRSQQVVNFGALSGGPRPIVQNQLNLSLAASYELDLWGRVASLTQAAELDLEATRRDLEVVAMTLSARVAETWFQIVEQRASLSLLESQIEANRTFLGLMEARFGEGLASALDVYQQRQQLAALKAQVPQTEARLQVLQHQMALLLAQPPTTMLPHHQNVLPQIAPLPAEGVVLDLLVERPDVRAAQVRVAAADYRIGAAIADRFPTLRLTGSTGFRAFELSDLFSNWLWNLAAGLAGPLFDGGRRAAEVDRTKAVLADQIAAYGQVVLTAMTEVEDALVQETKQRAFIGELDGQLELGRATFTEARSRYLAGLSDYLPVLTALQNLQLLEQRSVAAHRQLLSFRVQLCRALGGTWTQNLSRPS